VRRLAEKRFANGRREKLVESICVRLPGRLFSLFGGFEQHGRPGPHGRLEAGPHANHGARRTTGLTNVVYAFLVENVFQLAAEFRSF